MLIENTCLHPESIQEENLRESIGDELYDLLDNLFTCPHQPGHLRLLKTACAARYRRAHTLKALLPAARALALRGEQMKAEHFWEYSVYVCYSCPDGAKLAGKVVPFQRYKEGWKTCRKCGEEKELRHFYIDSKGAQGRKGTCIECTRRVRSTSGKRWVAADDHAVRLEAKAVEWGFETTFCMIRCLDQCTTRVEIEKLLEVPRVYLTRLFHNYGFKRDPGPKPQPYKYSYVERSSGDGRIVKLDGRTFIINGEKVTYSREEVPVPAYNGMRG